MNHVVPVEPKLPVVVAFEKWWLEQRDALEMSPAVKFAAWNGWLAHSKTTPPEALRSGETPRADAVSRKGQFYHQGWYSGEGEWMPAEEGRRLERELANALTDRETFRGNSAALSCENAQFREDLEKASAVSPLARSQDKP